MPFTFSHPAVIIPFLNKNRKYFSVTGLVAGSISPDFESFILLNDKKIYGHTWPGTLWFDLPLTIVLAIIFHGIVRDALIANLPWAWYEKFKCLEGYNWLKYFKKHFLVVITSMLIGIVSHLLLDALTHLNLYYPDATDSPIYLGHVQVYLLLQYTLSVVGMALVLYYLFKMPAAPIPRANHCDMQYNIIPGKHSRLAKATYWLLLLVFTGLSMALFIFILERPMNIILFIDVIIAGICSALIFVPLMQKLIALKRY